jgi:hypothetical protein
MENRDKGKMGQDMKRDVPLDKNKSDSSAEFGKNIGRSEDPLNEPSGSQDKWSDIDKQSGSE